MPSERTIIWWRSVILVAFGLVALAPGAYILFIIYILATTGTEVVTGARYWRIAAHNMFTGPTLQGTECGLVFLLPGLLCLVLGLSGFIRIIVRRRVR